MAEDEHDYKVGPGRPPLHPRFRKAQSGDPGDRSKKQLPALLTDPERAGPCRRGKPRRLDAADTDVTQQLVERYDGKSWPRWPHDWASCIILTGLRRRSI
jgi:hypothetical protein